MRIRSIVLTSALVCACAAVAQAQGADAARGTHQQVQGLRQAAGGRLIVPMTGTLTSQALPADSARPTTSPQQFQTRGPVTGSFSIQRFAQTTAGDVAAIGVLTLNLVDPTLGTPRTIVTESTIRVAPPADESSAFTSSVTRPATGSSAVMLSADSRLTGATTTQACQTLSLALRPVQLEIAGMGVRLDQVNVDFVSRTSGQLRNLLCGPTRVVTPAERASQLNALLNVVG